MARWRRILKLLGIAIAGLLVLLVLAYLLGIIGVPTVEAVENRFGEVNETDTVVLTDLTVYNPNPIGITLGGTSINYTVFMNEVAMANGYRSGLGIGTGNTTLNFTTYLANERIPEWWYTHVTGGEVTDLVIDADVSVGLLFGQTFSFEQSDEIETDIIGGFNSTQTRPINASMPIVSDPVLYLNETVGTWGDNITRTRTPIETAFRVYNPKSYPYTVTEIGYTIEMNNVTVGNGSTQRAQTIPPKAASTLTATTTIQNQALDEWWVSHLQHDQVTELSIDFYVVVDPQTSDVLGQAIDPIRIDTDAFDYTTTIETDIFGNKADAGDGSDGGTQSDGGSDGGTSEDGQTDGSGETATPTEIDETTTRTDSSTTTDDGGLLTDDETTTAESTTDSPTTTETRTTTTTTDDGVLPV